MWWTSDRGCRNVTWSLKMRQLRTKIIVSVSWSAEFEHRQEALVRFWGTSFVWKTNVCPINRANPNHSSRMFLPAGMNLEVRNLDMFSSWQISSCNPNYFALSLTHSSKLVIWTCFLERGWIVNLISPPLNFITLPQYFHMLSVKFVLWTPKLVRPITKERFPTADFWDCCTLCSSFRQASIFAGNLRLLNFMRKANPGIILLLALNGGDKTVADNLKHSFVHGQNRSDFVSTVVEKLRIWSLDGIMFHVDSMDFAASNTMSILIKVCTDLYYLFLLQILRNLWN